MSPGSAVCLSGEGSTGREGELELLFAFVVDEGFAHDIGEFFGLLQQLALEGLEIFSVVFFLQLLLFARSVPFHINANKSLSTRSFSSLTSFRKRPHPFSTPY